MNKERRVRLIAAPLIGFFSAFATDRIVNNNHIEIPVRREAPIGVLPEPMVLNLTNRKDLGK